MEELRQYVDTLIVVPNQRLLSMVAPGTSILEAFREADNVLRQGVSGIAEIIQLPSLINIDFADVHTVMSNKGTALIGIGVAKGPNRAVEAARNAIHSPLLEVTIDGATDAIVNISASQNLSLTEVDAAIDEIRNNSGKDVNIIFGTAINTDLDDELVVTVVATGYEMRAQSNGFIDIKDAIFRNMSDQNISFTKSENKTDSIFETSEPVQETSYDNLSVENAQRLDEIFEEVDPKAQKKLRRDEKKREKQEKKLSKKGIVQEEPVKQNQGNMPSWLHK